MSRYPKGYKKGDDIMLPSEEVSLDEAMARTAEDMARRLSDPEPRTLSRDYVVIKDANGQLVPVNVQAFIDEVGAKAELFGMPFNAILAMRAVYLEQGGKEPMTVQSVREIMG